MASNIISSFKAFGEKFKVPEKGERTDALKKYFARGGVISCVKSNGAWPKLIYPSPLRIKVQAKELEAILAQYEARQKDWKKKLEDAKSYHSRHQILKLKEPLYWQHKAKELSDSDYRQDSKSVSLPVHLVADPKWKPMIKMFVNNIEYRKNLSETVQNSIVYKNDKKVAKYADELQGFRSDMSEAQLKDLGKKISEMQGQIRALQMMEKWAKE